MGIVAQPTLTGLASGTVPSGFAAIRGTFGENTAGTGFTSLSGATNDSAIFTGIATQADFSIYIEQIIRYVNTGSPVGTPNIFLPVFRSNAGGTTGYVLGTAGPNTYTLYSGNLSTGTFSAIGSAQTVSYIPQVGDTACVLALVHGTSINIYIWNKLYGQPSRPQIVVTDSAITAAGYAGLFGANFSGVASRCPIVTVFRVGQALFYNAPTYQSGTSTGVTLAIPGPTGGTAPYTWQLVMSRTAGSPQSGQTNLSGLSGTFATSGAASQNVTIPVAAGDLQYVRALYTDSGSTPETQIGDEVAIQPLASKAYIFIGDSLTFGTGSTGGNDPVSLISPMLAALNSPSAIAVSNQGVGGSTTAVWFPGAGGGYLATAIAAGVSASATDVNIMLGTNDSHSNFTAATYTSNMTAIIAALFAGISTLQRVWLCNPPYEAPNGAGNVYSEPDNALLRQYAAANAALVNGTTILQGADAYGAFAQFRLVQPSGFYNADGIHLSNTGYACLAALWANAIMSTTPPVVGGGGANASVIGVTNKTVGVGSQINGLYISAGPFTSGPNAGLYQVVDTKGSIYIDSARNILRMTSV